MTAEQVPADSEQHEDIETSTAAYRSHDAKGTDDYHIMSDSGPPHQPVIGKQEPPSPRFEATAHGLETRVSSPHTFALIASNDERTQLKTSEVEECKDQRRDEEEAPTIRMRVHFEDFAHQLRQHRHHEHRKRMLAHRQHQLQKAITLSSRLDRVTSWIHDGLVEISGHCDASGFIRVHQHMQDLVDICFSHWNQEIQAGEVLDSLRPRLESGSDTQSFLHKLRTDLQNDCLEFVRTVRDNPRFLIERFKALGHAQIAALSESPKYQDLSESVLTNLSRSRGRASQKKRIKSFSKELEDYATSFERSNPLSFLLFNVYGTSKDSRHPENQLRLSTWSTICATLMIESEQSYHALINQTLSAFAGISQWRIRERMELFLMDVLQRGAFLLEQLEDRTRLPRFQSNGFDPLDTPQAREFFDQAVRDLFSILSSGDNGFPSGALDLGRSILGNLSDIGLQSKFRGEFYFEWFLSNFLRITITYPENEKMLLQFHISDNARIYILHTLWKSAYARATEIFNPEPPLQSEYVRLCVTSMIDQLVETRDVDTPYRSRSPLNAGETNIMNEPSNVSSISICAADITKALEALSPQIIHTSPGFHQFMDSSRSAFTSQYAHASNKFDRLRREMIFIAEPGSSSKNTHPCQEQWVTLDISNKGYVELHKAPISSQEPVDDMFSAKLGPLDPVQEAAIRIVFENSLLSEGSISGLDYVDSHKTQARLSDLFLRNASAATLKSDHVDALYWHTVHKHMTELYPVAIFAQDDTRVLKKLYDKSQMIKFNCLQDCLVLQERIGGLEDILLNFRNKISQSADRLDKLRVKLWYAMDVISSNAYEDAKNVSMALNNMAMSALGVINDQGRLSLDQERPGTGTSTSSLFDQPRNDMMTILKAPAEHGGAKKLDDKQIEMTKKWLERNGVDNFCKGEERIHRFCMEVKVTMKKLVGESLQESPVLWSSELFAREKSQFDVHSSSLLGGIVSTRASSILSDSFSNALNPSRPGIRNLEGGTRSLGHDLPGLPIRKTSFHSLGSGRTGKDTIGSELTSSIDSPGRALTATTAESEGSIFSRFQSMSRSVTSASLHSRPSSIFNESGAQRIQDSSREKNRFLGTLQQELTCLLLSDLGCPVWSCGSETDAWIESFRSTPSINRQLQQRKLTESLLLESLHSRGRQVKKEAKLSRSLRSASLHLASNNLTDAAATSTPPIREEGDNFVFDESLQNVLNKISEQVDPLMKLRAVHEFKTLALSAFGAKKDHSVPITTQKTKTRHRSLDSGILSSTPQSAAVSGSKISDPIEAPSEAQTVQYLKELLLSLHPRTLFRDLQYIAAFVPSDTLNKTESGRAFLHVGLAALASKDEVCRSMVDVADRIVARHNHRESSDQDDQSPLTAAAEYWIFAAREGHAIAQRELASLYLTNPGIPPIVSLPLSLSSEIFKSEMMWEQQSGEKSNTQALCLALHWMQQAAENGDEIAEIKLKERQESRSIR